MITWYSDEEISILFDKVPNVRVRYITPFTKKEEEADIKEKPFENLSEIKVRIIDQIEQEVYDFSIPEHYTWNGANIPRPVWCIIGSATYNGFLIASMVHDRLCENHDLIDNNRALSTDAFNVLLKVAKINPISRFFMKNSVAFFQTLFCKW
jgi:uncharacterized protein (DUF4213/DUF364 family)